MEFLKMALIVIFIILSFVLMFFILIQSGKGGSLGIMGGASNTPFGASTMDIVEKITWWGIALFFVFAILLAILFAEPRRKITIPEETPPNIPVEKSNTEQNSGEKK
ncbi:MAG: preprotein translocase subunit SecG [Leptospiraceae bacterium]|nr:preprotein translocase subunit SecG [Leptospiraceae bacterium]MDW7975486.1 preprotein translocase subunit SecG [Leptospiraceae bacterium]